MEVQHGGVGETEGEGGRERKREGERNKCVYTYVCGVMSR